MPSPSRAAGCATRVVPAIPICALLLLHWILAVTATLEKSPTFDEGAHLATGYSYWRTGDYRLQPQNGMLPQRWGALPLLAGAYRFPSLDSPAWHASDEFALGYLFLYGEGNDPQTMLTRARATMALLSVLLGALVYAWARRLFGRAGALLSLTLYTFSPTMLAHGPLVTSDVAGALFFSASVWALWRMLERTSPGRVLASALAVTGLALSKMSAFLIAPMALLMAAVRLASPQPLDVRIGRASRRVAGRGGQLAVLAAAAAAHVVVILVVLWAGYGFRYQAFHETAAANDVLGWEEVQPVSPIIELARAHHLLPEAYLYGLAFVQHYAGSRRAFLDGRHSWRGWWWFFPYCLAVKTPLPLFALLLLAAGAAVRAARDAPGRRAVLDTMNATTPLWTLLVVYWVAALGSHLNIGHRHLLPTYPAMFILAGGAAAHARGRSRVLQALVLAALAAFVIDSLRIRPDYLAYFNRLAGGPSHGYRHLVDSSLDWGQDLPGLKTWLDRHGAGTKVGEDADTSGGARVYLSYFGAASPEHYGIRAQRLPGYFDHWRPGGWYALTGGVYAISATMLQQVYSWTPGPWARPYEDAYQEIVSELRAGRERNLSEETVLRGFTRERRTLFEHLRFARLCAFLRRREPDDEVGHSILIYRLSDDDVRRALDGPPAELTPDVAVEGFRWTGMAGVS